MPYVLQYRVDERRRLRNGDLYWHLNDLVNVLGYCDLLVNINGHLARNPDYPDLFLRDRAEGAHREGDVHWREAACLENYAVRPGCTNQEHSLRDPEKSSRRNHSVTHQLEVGKNFTVILHWDLYQLFIELFLLNWDHSPWNGVVLRHVVVHRHLDGHFDFRTGNGHHNRLLYYDILGHTQKQPDCHRPSIEGGRAKV